MSDPLSLVPLALAAGGGSIDGHSANQVVAAGLTLLQRSATVVRASSGRRAAILLPTSPAFLTALAASEGRGAVLVNPLAAPPEVEHQLRDANVGIVHTTAALASRLPPGTPHVLLDDAPRSARVVADGGTREVDLGSHTGIHLEGEPGVSGRDEEAAVVYTSAMDGVPLGAVLTHRNLLANGWATVEAGGMTGDDHMLALLPFSHLFGLVVTGIAPLLVGARVTTLERFNPLRALDLLESDGVSVVVGVPAIFHALVAAMERRGAPLRAPALRLCICGGAPLPLALQARWADLTGVELRQGYGLTEGGPVCLFNRVDRPNHRGALG
ncbi:MAG TPA: AMP-binding protein, partial [Gemmatimonadaceae bacterium]|nr:AMP-binding protein [Gemmatimonadaceae bacterium]